MLKVGCVSIDTSHPRGMAMLMESNCMDMRYTYLWDKGFRKPEEVEWFSKRFGMTVVDDVKEMVEHVDIGFIHPTNWEKHLELAMPFIEAGKPVFLDKPIVGSVEDVAKTRELLKKGAKIIGASSIRYCDEIQKFLAEPVEDRGEVVAVFGTCGTNEFDYAIHVVEGMSELAGCKAKSGRFIGKGKTTENQDCDIYSIEFENGVRGVYYNVIGRYNPFHFTIVTTKGTRSFVVDNSKIILVLLKEIYKEAVYGKSMITDVENLLNCTEIMLCCKKSRDELGGKDVTIDMLEPGDKFDGYAFEKDYGSKAGILYKD